MNSGEGRDGRQTEVQQAAAQESMWCRRAVGSLFTARLGGTEARQEFYVPVLQQREERSGEDVRADKQVACALRAQSNPDCRNYDTELGHVQCTVCGEKFESRVTALSDAVDIYSEWCGW